MNIYTRLYHNLVESRKHLKEQWKPVGSLLERHHITPRHVGGTDEDENFTYLTHREHIIAHWLLWKIHKRDEDKSAWKLMKGMTYWPIRKNAVVSAETRRKMSEAKKGKKRSAEARKRISEGKKGKKRGPHSEEAKKRMSEAHKGKKRGPLSEEQKRKISEALKGKSKSEETKKKLSEAKKGKKLSEEHKRKIREAKRALVSRRV